MSKLFIPANPDRLSKAFWGRYFERSAKRHFQRCLVAGEEHLQSTLVRGSSAPCPTIIACTHGSWWDAAITIVMSLRTYGLDADGLMEHRQLTKYRFFSRIGMFSVVREDPRSALFSLQYAASRLQGTDRTLWMFPQGTLINQETANIDCEPGIAILAKMLGTVRIVPLALRYEMLRFKKSTCWAKFGEPLTIEWTPTSTIAQVTSAVSNALTVLSSNLRNDAINENDATYRSFI
ncbi:MAG: lysophospholipid acyltransferase family protein [Candidatus Kapabacteria bacterium]|nr:lysophospholipid acyltransferase family protein [Candidatus Kapabacteria bacterium]